MDNNFLYTQADDYSSGKLNNKVPNVSGAEFLDEFTLSTE
jgi:hypothetical protein